MVDVAIIGGGVAGLTAALHLSRAGRRTTVFDAPTPARNATSHGLHGVPGLDRIGPEEFRRRAWSDLAQYDLATRSHRTVVDIAPVDGEGYEVHTRCGEAGQAGEAGEGERAGEGGTLRAQRVLLATGMQDVLPPVEGLATCWGTSVIHCTHCAGWEHRGRAWAVVADHPGYAAVAASIVAPWTTDVIVLASDDIAGLRHESGRLRAVELTDGSLVERDTLLWHLPQRAVPLITHLAERRSLAVDAHGFVEVDDRYRTNLPGLFAAGDAASKAQTAITAMAAASTAAHWLMQ